MLTPRWASQRTSGSHRSSTPKAVEQLRPVMRTRRRNTPCRGTNGRTFPGSELRLAPTQNSQVQAELERLSQVVMEQQNAIAALQSKLDHTPASPTPFSSQGSADRRLGGFDARFHSTSSAATPSDYRVLPDRIFLVRHAESQGNVDNASYSHTPDHQVSLTERGTQQARAAGKKIRDYIEQKEGKESDYRLFFYTSPYKRSLQTYEHISSVFDPDCIMGVQEEVQLREQDFGNFQDPAGKQREKADRLRFGRFYYRFPDGESGADVYDRLTIFEDHLIRDVNAGRFNGHTNLVLVTHGLALRIFLMRWFHWTVDQFLSVFNPDNAEPLVLERVPSEQDARPNGPFAWVHTKALYRLTPESMAVLRGVTQDMCRTDHKPRAFLRDPYAAADTVGSAQLLSTSSEEDLEGGPQTWADPCHLDQGMAGLCDVGLTLDDLTVMPAGKTPTEASRQSAGATAAPSSG